METCPLHRWDLSPDEAAALQGELRPRVVLEDRFGEIRTVAGVDVHYDEAAGTARAAVAVLGFPSLDLLETAVAQQPTPGRGPAPLRLPRSPGQPGGCDRSRPAGLPRFRQPEPIRAAIT